jgi:hypothetical protein
VFLLAAAYLYDMSGPEWSINLPQSPSQKTTQEPRPGSYLWNLPSRSKPGNEREERLYGWINFQRKEH